MNKEPTVDGLHESTIKYYNLRPILKDMPHRIPRGPTPDAPAEKARLMSAMQEAMRNRRVLEIACGAGGATKEIAELAESIVGIDMAPNALAKARASITRPTVRFLHCDAFDLSGIPGTFTAGLVAGFLHICPAARHAEFLGGFHDRLEPGAVVFMYSSRPSSPDAKSRLFRVEGHRDQYMTRQLSDGSEFVMVENDFTEDGLRDIFGPLSPSLKIHVGNYWWWIQYTR